MSIPTFVPRSSIRFYGPVFRDARTGTDTRVQVADRSLVTTRTVILLDGLAAATPIPVPQAWVGQQVSQCDPCTLLDAPPAVAAPAETPTGG